MSTYPRIAISNAHPEDPRIWTPVFAMVFAAAFLNEIAFSFMINLPGYFSDLGASEGQIGLVFALAGVASLLSRPMIGRWLDLLGRKPILVVGAAANAVSLLLFITVSAFGPWMFVARAIFVVSEISLFTAFLTYAADSLPEARRTQGLALYGLSGLVPIGLGSLLAEAILAAWGFTGLFMIGAACVTASLSILVRLPRRPREELGTLPRRSVWAVVTQRSLVPMWLVTFLLSIEINVLFTYTRTFVDETGIGSVGLFFGTYSASAVGLRLVVSVLPQRKGYGRVVVPMFFVIALTLFLLSITESNVLFVTAAVLGGGAHGVVFPVISSEVVRRARVKERGSAIAIFTSLFDIALIGAIPIIGRVIDTSGYPAAFEGSAALVAVGTVVYWVLDRRNTSATEALSGADAG